MNVKVKKKKEIRKDAGYRCLYCNEEGHTIDHLIPKAKGGNNELSNLACACGGCNTLKSNLDYKTFIEAFKNGNLSALTFHEVLELHSRITTKNNKKYAALKRLLSEEYLQERLENDRFLSKDGLFDKEVFLSYIKTSYETSVGNLPKWLRKTLRGILEDTMAGVAPHPKYRICILSSSDIFSRKGDQDVPALTGVASLFYHLLWDEKFRVVDTIFHMEKSGIIYTLPEALQTEIARIKETYKKEIDTAKEKLRLEMKSYLSEIKKERIKKGKVKLEKVEIGFDQTILFTFIKSFVTEHETVLPKKLKISIERFLRKVENEEPLESADVSVIGGHYYSNKDKGANPIIIVTLACTFVYHALCGRRTRAIDRIGSILKRNLMNCFDQAVQKEMIRFCVNATGVQNKLRFEIQEKIQEVYQENIA